MDVKAGELPGRAKITHHPEAASFPTVGMTLGSYRRDSFARSPRVSRWSRFRSKITKKRVILAFVTVVVVLVGWLGWKFIYNESKIFGGSIFGLFNSTRLKGEDVGRVNILLAGNSADDPGHGGADLTDSIMLISIDTRDNSAYLISIPRDLWVNVPGYGYSKINAAYVDGQNGNFSESGYPSGGMGLLEKVVEQDFQVPIDYYALINYAGMRDAVNAVGGINIDIHSCDPRGLYDPDIDYATGGPLVDLSNGEHHLNGEQALDLARARGDSLLNGFGPSYGFCDSDFTRTQNQREMLIALKDKIISASTLANPFKLSSLMDALGNNVRTDFKTSEIRRLYDITKQINGSSIKSIGLNSVNGQDLLTSCQDQCEGSALVPAAGFDNFSQIDLYLKRLLSNDAVTKEAATVVLLNGTNTYGLAASKSKNLESKGVDVTQIADARSEATGTTIINNSHGTKPATLRLLESLYGTNVTTTNSYNGQYNSNFIVILGADQIAQQ